VFFFERGRCNGRVLPINKLAANQRDGSSRTSALAVVTELRACDMPSVESLPGDWSRAINPHCFVVVIYDAAHNATPPANVMAAEHR
jgi:hypothetical protein